jgi:hypothetical protein
LPGCSSSTGAAKRLPQFDGRLMTTVAIETQHFCRHLVVVRFEWQHVGNLKQIGSINTLN